MGVNFLLINSTDFLLINSSGDKLIISITPDPGKLIIDGDSIVTGTRVEV